MLVTLALSLVAHAGSLQVRGRLVLAEGSGRGEITIDENTIEVETRKLFSTRSLSVRLDDAESVRISRSLSGTEVQMAMKDGSTVSLQTSRKHYADLKALLKARIT
jgi:hypothetical protein